ncbi:MAG: transporter [bacterium]
MQYNAYYSTDTYKDRHGDSVSSVAAGPVNFDIETDIDVLAITPLFFWSTEKEILGAKNSWYLAPSFAKGNVAAGISSVNLNGSFDSNSSGMADLYMQPIMLGWKNPDYDFNLGLGVYLPVGKYDVDEDDNVGLGFWTGQVQGAFYYYLYDQATALMLAATYEAHEEKDGTDITPGNHLTLEYGVSQYLSQRLEVGLSGYYQRQVDDDSGNDGFLDLDVKSKVSGFGAQLSYWTTPRLSLSLKYMKEYDAKARFEGDWIVFNLTYLPGPVF